jgi:DNA polymerase-3 subunit epsilon
MEFSVLDFETANPDFASICQVGIATFRDSEPVELWSSLVNPEDEFSPINISIHGIEPHHVANSPTLPAILPEIHKRLESKVAITHTAFDQVALRKACEKYELPPHEYNWLNSARVVRRVWEQFSKSGYGLSNVAKHLNIEYQEHDALEDARCTGIVLLQAMQISGCSLDGFFDLIKKPLPGTLPYPDKVRRGGNPDGELSGEHLVFTGSLSVSRSDAADMAASLGCAVDSGVTKHTTILVVGNQDIRHLNGKEKSRKHQKAEKLIASGQAIRILCEEDFNSIVSMSSKN